MPAKVDEGISGELSSTVYKFPVIRVLAISFVHFPMRLLACLAAVECPGDLAVFVHAVGAGGAAERSGRGAFGACIGHCLGSTRRR